VELIASPILDAGASLGEGPLWDSQAGLLHWIDINNNRVHTFDPQSGKDSFKDVGEKIGCIVKRSANSPSDGGFIISLPEKFASLRDGKVTTIAILEQGLGNRMNDGKCDPAGRFWCGSVALDEKEGAGNLWMMDKDLTITKKLSGVTISNGLAWTADCRTLYYIDTPTGHLEAFDYDIASGAITNRRVAFKNTWGGHFDGMTIDTDDNLYIAIWSGGCVLKINPRTAQLLARITVPGVKNVTCCTFGGPALEDLFITTAAAGADRQAEPNAGALFHINLNFTGNKGLPAFEFCG